MNCPLCHHTGALLDNDSYYTCPVCDAYYKDETCYISHQEEKIRYELHENYVEDPGYQKFTSPLTERILQHYMPHHKGLDFGCGTGPVITHVLSKKGYHIRLFDPFFYPDYTYLQDSFDYVFACEVFEHFKHPEDEIRQLLQITKPGGRILIMTHLYYLKTPFKDWYYRKDPTHVFIYTPRTMAYIAKTFHLEVEDITERLTVFRKAQ